MKVLYDYDVTVCVEMDGDDPVVTVRDTDGRDKVPQSLLNELEDAAVGWLDDRAEDMMAQLRKDEQRTADCEACHRAREGG